MIEKEKGTKLYDEERVGMKRKADRKARWGTHQENRETNSSIFIGKF